MRRRSLPTRRLGALSLAAATSLLAAKPALAEGLAPSSTPLGARARATGGMFVALADDPTALHYNPAGLVLQPGSVYGDLGVTVTQQGYQFVRAQGGAIGNEQKADAAIGILPNLAYVTRPGEGRVGLGVGLFRTFGATTDYVDVALPGKAKDEVYEIVPGFAFAASNVLQVGGALRFGIGRHESEGTDIPVPGSVSAMGVGFGASLGLMLAPTPSLRIGASWRSGMSIKMSGTWDTLVARPTTGPQDPITFYSVDVEIDQRWPQEVRLGLAFSASDALILGAEVDWADWSTLDQVRYSAGQISGEPDISKATRTDLDDTITARLGGRYQLSPTLSFAAGYSLSTPSVPDRSAQRHYFDGLAHQLGLGSSIGLTDTMRLDLAAELGLMSRSVPDNLATYTAAGWPERANPFPGDYSRTTFGFELAVVFLY